MAVVCRWLLLFAVVVVVVVVVVVEIRRRAGLSKLHQALGPSRYPGSIWAEARD